MTQHSLQFASIYTPLVMLFHAKFKIGRTIHTVGLKNINKLYRYTIGKWVSLFPVNFTDRKTTKLQEHSIIIHYTALYHLLINKLVVGI